MTSNLWRLGAVETAAGIRAGDFTATEVITDHLARMAAVNPSINAIVDDLSATALADAKAADAELAAGKPRGPLHGVPVTIKENVDMAGKSAPSGVPAFKDTVSKADAPVVANLRRAGAIPIARTNSPEFALRWFTDNPMHGLTLNPWGKMADQEVTPGGSSGGAAASLALGVGTLAHGNDLGGSLRYPAYCCGLVTIKPSQGRIPAYNSTAPEERPLGGLLMSAQGPIARQVKDLRPALAAMAAPDLRDPWHTLAPVALTASTARARVAVTLGGVGPVDPVVEASLRQAADHLAAAGHKVTWIDPPNLAGVTEGWQDILTAEIREFFLPVARQHGSDDVNKVLDYYIANARPTEPGTEMPTYARALAARTAHLRHWAKFMDSYPLILMPVSQQRQFPQGADAISATRSAELLAAQAPMYLISYLGLPAAAVPTGVEDGLPTGIQLAARRFREDQCIDAAEVIETAVGGVLEELWARG